MVTPSSSWSIRVPDWWEVDAVGAVLDLSPACTDAHRGPSARDQVDGRDRLGQDGRMAIANGVHEGSALHPLCLAGEGGVHGDGFQTGGVGWVAGGAVEVVPDRDPIEAEGLDPLPQEAQLVRRGVLQAGVYTEAGHRGPRSLVRATERQRGSGQHRPAWPGNAVAVQYERPSASEGAASTGLRGRGTQLRKCERPSASEGAASTGLRGRGTQLRRHLVGT